MEYTDEPEFLMDDPPCREGQLEEPVQAPTSEDRRTSGGVSVRLEHSRPLSDEELLLVVGSARVSLNELLERLRGQDDGGDWRAQ